MDWELFELGIEALKAVVLIFITAFLPWAGRQRKQDTRGWSLILAGFGLMAFAAVLDLADEFEELQHVWLIGNTEVQSFLEKVVGYVGGYLLLLFGLLRWFPTMNQLTERLEQQVKERTHELSRMIRYNELVLEHSHDLIVACDAEGRILLSNDKQSREQDSPSGLTVTEWADTAEIHNDCQAAPLAVEQHPLVRALKGEQIHRQELVFSRGEQRRILRVSSCPIQDEKGRLLGAMMSAHDITRQKTLAEQLRFQATHDSLTGLPNRMLFTDRVQQALLRGHRQADQLAVLMLDLDKFKQINDTFGHAGGDQLLQQVAGRLLGVVRDCDTVTRLGGDEFAILLEHLGDSQDPAGESTRVARRILKEFSTPFILSGRGVRVGVSIGIALSPRDGTDLKTLLCHADSALYHAKSQGRHCFSCYDPELDARELERLTMSKELEQALAEEQFVLHYQPQLQAVSGRCAGVEALLRWQHPEKGLLPAGDFIAHVEQSGLIVPLGEWVIQSACRQLRRWRQQGVPVHRVAVNLSERQLHHAGLVSSVAQSLADSGLPPGSLELELTESMLIKDNRAMLSLLNTLKELGVLLAIDDFGTGYSSLSYLRQFPVARLKLDRSFVCDIPNDTVISEAIIALAHRLSLQVVAEGVETEAQKAFLTELGCEELQGFLFARALPPEELVQWLSREGRACPSRAPVREGVMSPGEVLASPVPPVAG
ncbi:putative bifunctional diguanylate cyclase/phosphodiesterase [Oceanimonas marisflavi]|uniref:putative bifunctional diguanylate cyclase/phosphodiesterase n=1 Tax=Oceanimonas marisflavi TaxID=2059724 RepID=UPI000D30ECDB|nr:GGDEF and EAL domain-containing protein [Oceanimonas marisflavi]